MIEPGRRTGRRLYVWQIDDTSGFDAAWAEVRGSRLAAEGHAVGQVPVPFSTVYRVQTTDDFVTARVRVESRWSGGSAAVDLRRDARGAWMVDGELRADLEGALDCDLGLCPLTNTMPVLRHDLLAGPADRHLTMAFIEVPSLRVVPSLQRYTHVGALDNGGAVIKYRSDSFESDVVFDHDGFVVDYPQLGRRMVPAGA